MKVYYTAKDLEVVIDLEHLVLASLENTGVFRRFWTDVSNLANYVPGGRSSTMIRLAPGYAVYFLGGRDSLCAQLSGVGGGICTTTQQGVVVAARTGIELSLGTKVDQVGRTVAHLVTRGVGSAAADLANTFLKLKTKKLTTSTGDEINTATAVTAKGMDPQAAVELIELQQKTITIVCVYNADTAANAAPSGGAGTYKTGIINSPVAFGAIARLLTGFQGMWT